MSITAPKPMILEFFDYFIPPDKRDDASTLTRSYILVGIIIANIFTCLAVLISLLTYYQLPSGNHELALLIDLALLFGYIIILMLFRWRIDFRMTGNLTVAMLAIVQTISTQITGGFHESPIVQLTLLIPITGFLLLGLRDGIRWLFVAVVINVALLISAELQVGYGQLIVYENDVQLMTMLLRFVLFFMAGGALIIYELINTNLTARLNEERNKFEHEASHDHLTGIANRSEFFRRLEAGVAECQHRNQKMAVVYIDLDGFKPINDKYGHHAGDKILVDVASRLQKVLRLSDTVARLGGDEFALILPGIKVPSDVQMATEKALKAIRKPVDIGNLEVVVDGSLGISIYPDNSEDSEDLCRFADAAMYVAKEHNQGYAYYSEELNLT